jgi:hypothetical protein
MSANAPFEFDKAEEVIKSIVRQYIQTMELNFDEVGRFTIEQMKAAPPAINIEKLKAILGKYYPIDFKMWEFEGQQLPCNLFFDPAWSMNPEIYTGLFYKIMEVDKAFIQVASMFFPSLPPKYLSMFEHFLPFVYTQDVMNICNIDGAMVCKPAANMTMVNLVLSRIESLELILDWASRLDIDKITANPNPSNAKNPMLFPIGNTPIEKIQIILLQDKDGQAKIKFHSPDREPLEMTAEDEWLADKRSKTRPLNAWRTLKQLAKANGGPIPLESQHVSNLNKILKKILVINYRAIKFVGDNKYRASFKCSIYI